MASYVRVLMLIWTDILAIYAMWSLMAYLTNVWKLEITHAAALVAIFWGLYDLLGLLQTFIAETIMGDYWMLYLFTISFSAGLGFLTMSTPPVLAHITGNCSDYKPECIGHAQKVLLYTSLPLIAFGMAVSSKWTCYENVIRHRLIIGENKLDGRTRKWCEWCIYGTFTLIAVLGLPYIKPWSLRFGIPAICTLAATLLFSTTVCSYRHLRPHGSVLTIFIRVLVAAASKLFYKIPTDSNELYEIQDAFFFEEEIQYSRRLIPRTTSLRCLDKASIVVPTKPLREQRDNRWTLCRVTEVEMTKGIIRMIPVLISFIFCGVVYANGFTYFMAQLDHMNPKVGSLKVPTLVLVWFFKKAQMKCLDVSGDVFDILALSDRASRNFTSLLGIIISMILSILSCITAAKVENRRLGVVQMHGLVDKPDETVPMTMFWLLPQFLLLGASDGVLCTSTQHFFHDDCPFGAVEYLPEFRDVASGVGVLCSILSVFVVGKISEKGGQTNWFQHDLNNSRLDKYYWTLAWLMAVNLAVFVVVAILYRRNQSKLRDEGLPSANLIDDTYTWTFCCFFHFRITRDSS